MYAPDSVLVSDASSYKAVVLCRYLRRYRPGLRILTCDHRTVARALHTAASDEHHLLPAAPGRSGYSEALAELVARSGAQLLIPVNSAEMAPLLQERRRFGAALWYWGSRDSYEVLHDKGRLRALCKGLGIRTPRHYSSPADARFPVVVKPRASSASRGVRYCRNAIALRRALRRSADPAKLIVQEYIKGAGAGFSVFARHGEILAAAGHRRLAEWPVTGGSSTYRETFDHGDMRRIASEILAATRWSGFAMFEFKLAPEPVLIEVNPRIWGSIHQALAAGAPLLEPLLGPGRVLPRGKARTYLSPIVYVSLLGYLLRGNPKPVLDFLTHWRVNRADISLLRDPSAWLGSLARHA